MEGIVARTHTHRNTLTETHTLQASHEASVWLRPLRPLSLWQGLPFQAGRCLVWLNYFSVVRNTGRSERWAPLLRFISPSKGSLFQLSVLKGKGLRKHMQRRETEKSSACLFLFTPTLLLLSFPSVSLFSLSGLKRTVPPGLCTEWTRSCLTNLGGTERVKMLSVFYCSPHASLFSGSFSLSLSLCCFSRSLVVSCWSFIGIILSRSLCPLLYSYSLSVFHSYSFSFSPFLSSHPLLLTSTVPLFL